MVKILEKYFDLFQRGVLSRNTVSLGEKRENIEKFFIQNSFRRKMQTLSRDPSSDRQRIIRGHEQDEAPQLMQTSSRQLHLGSHLTLHLFFAQRKISSSVDVNSEKSRGIENRRRRRRRSHSEPLPLMKCMY